MIEATLVVDPPYQENRIFDAGNQTLNRDNCLAPIREVRARLAALGADLATQDIHPVERSAFTLYCDAPRKLPPTECRQTSFLLALEHPLIRPANDDPENPRRYRKIFTWNDQRVDGDQIIKVNFSSEVPDRIPMRTIKEKPKLALVISANKQLADPRELYSKRIETIRWFEHNHPDDFDLYGFGWGEHCFNGWKHKLNRLAWLRRNWPRKPYHSWRGAVDDKYETMQSYRFSICYENVKDSPGWITEKIFDALFAGCVPVYRGANNITSYVPAACFIDERRFKSHEELYAFLVGMTQASYRCYLEAAQAYIKSDRIRQFTAAHFGETIATTIMASLESSGSQGM